MAIRLSLIRTILLGLGLLSVAAGSSLAESTELPVAADQPLQKMSFEQYQAEVARLRDLVATCKASPQACDWVKVGGDTQVTGGHVSADKGGFSVHWSWLRETLDGAKNPKEKDRDQLLDEASKRLDDDAREASVVPTSTGVPFKQARADADKVLASAEFQHVTRNPFWDKMAARAELWLSRIFGGVSKLGRSAPWLGPVIEWGFIALALAAVVVWALRVFERQRRAMRLEGPAAMTHWQEVSRDWAKLAETAAARDDWREAVHAVYWASVTELEGRRVWRQNNARTPREYLRLLETESPMYKPLRMLTQSLERVWYGLTPAAQSDYDDARRMYEELRSA